MPVECDPADPVAEPADEQARAAIRYALFAWYHVHGRTLPWRAPPGGATRPDPYRVWLSEVMLQQTTVAAVTPYFERFTARWPTIAALAAADDADILGAWAGLGYYSRARNLIAAARVVVAQYGGVFPAAEAQLRTLPGVGDYTAAAIAAFAFGADAIPLDANLERVLARLFLIDTPLPQAKPIVRIAARAVWPAEHGGDFAQALMDLGARICTARRPRCDLCPVAAQCAARAVGRAEALPVKAPRRAKPERYGIAHWIVKDDRVWLIRRPPRGLLGGMRALPGGDWSDRSGCSDAALGIEGALGNVRHVFTHFILHLSVQSAPVTLATGPGEWWPITELDAAGLPTLYRRAATVAQELNR